MKKLFLLVLIVLFSLTTFTSSSFATSFREFVEQNDILLTTYANGWWGGSRNNPGTLSDLNIQQYFISEAIRVHDMLDIGWNQYANTMARDIPFSTVVNETLTLFDKYGMTATFEIPLSDYGTGSPWAKLVITDYPDLRTYMPDGTAWNDVYVRPDSNNLSVQLFEDMKQLYSYYGAHKSWVGFQVVGGIGSDAGGYVGGCDPPRCRGRYGYGNDSVIAFANNSAVPYKGVGLECTDGLTPSSTCSYLLAAASGQSSTSEIYSLLQNYHSNYPWWIEANFLYQFSLALKNLSQYAGREFFLIFGSNPYSYRTDNLIYGDSLTLECNSPVNSYAKYVNTILTMKDIQRFPLMRLSQGVCPLTRQALFNNFLIMPFWGGDTPMSFILSDDYIQNTGSLDFQILTDFGQKLNRMRNVGGYYGGNNQNAPKVLYPSVLYENPFIQFLTPSLNITISSDSNLTSYGDLSQFDVIFCCGGLSLTDNALSRIEQFVRNGGGFVYFSSFTYANNIVASILGVNATTDPVSSSTAVVNPTHPILKPYNESQILNGGYYFYAGNGGWGNRFAILPEAVSTVTPVINQSGVGPVLWTNNYFSGRSVFIGNSYGQIGHGNLGPWSLTLGAAERDSLMVLINNAIFWAAKQENRIPTWWYSDFKTGSQSLPWTEDTYYSIVGMPEKPLLVWFFTNSTTPDNIELNLNASYFGIDKNWIAINTLDWNVTAKGDTDDIKLNVTIPAQNWYPVYIMNNTADKQFLYSNLRMKSRNEISGNVTYSLEGPYSFSSWMITRSDNKPTSVKSNSAGVLTEYDSLATLNNSWVGMKWDGSQWLDLKEEGWFWDADNKLLYVHFKN